MKGITPKMLFDDNPEEKFPRSSSEVNVIPKGVPVTREGKALVYSDPMISAETVSRLFETDGHLIDGKEKRDFLRTAPSYDIFKKYFLDDNETGIAHISMIINDNPGQCLLELISTYCADSVLPFVEGCARIRSYMDVSPFTRFVRYGKEYRPEPWEPIMIYLPRVGKAPPVMKAARKRYPTYSPRGKEENHLPDCPLCGCKAELFRCGVGMIGWHACCTDQTECCPNFLGMSPAKTRKEAERDWIRYAAEERKRIAESMPAAPELMSGEEGI